MVRDWWRRLSGLPLEKPIVVFALTVAMVFGAVRLIEGASFFSTLTQAAGIAFALMVVLAIARGLWRGDDVEEAEAAGWRLRLGVARKAVGALERRVDAHTRATDQRLLDLEREVFKNGNSG